MAAWEASCVYLEEFGSEVLDPDFACPASVQDLINEEPQHFLLLDNIRSGSSSVVVEERMPRQVSSAPADFSISCKCC
jgi:hypothetical protein